MRDPVLRCNALFSERPSLQEMFQTQRKRSKFVYAFEMGELIFHSVVRDIRKSHSNAVVGLLLNLIQATLFVAAFLCDVFAAGNERRRHPR